jgi:hypothetical protein
MVKKKVEELSGCQVIRLSGYLGFMYVGNDENNDNIDNNDNKITMTTPPALIQPIRHFQY